MQHLSLSRSEACVFDILAPSDTITPLLYKPACGFACGGGRGGGVCPEARASPELHHVNTVTKTGNCEHMHLWLCERDAFRGRKWPFLQMLCMLKMSMKVCLRGTMWQIQPCDVCVWRVPTLQSWPSSLRLEDDDVVPVVGEAEQWVWVVVTVVWQLRICCCQWIPANDQVQAVSGLHN